MAELVQRYLDEILAEHADVGDGELSDYIPELAEVDPAGFGLSLELSDGFVYESGDTAVEFAMQSLSKPFTYALALAEVGPEAVDQRIGVEPSGEAYNLISVDENTKKPKNAMINIGAIASVSLVPAATSEQRFERILGFYSECAGRRLEVNDDMYNAQMRTGSRNRAVTYLLDSFGILDEDPDEVLDAYVRQCSIMVTSTDLARMAATLARGGFNPFSGLQVASGAVVQRTLSVMATCGMYDGSGEWFSSVGMPAKSGIGGGIIAVLPNQLGIGVYSPLLDENGNSVRGKLVCRSLSAELGLHVLNVTRESRSIIRDTHDVQEGIRVYELHGDLTFAGAEQVLRTIEDDRDEVDVAILEVSRVDEIADVARNMLAGMREMWTSAGKEGFLVDPDHLVVPGGGRDAIGFDTIEEAIEAASARRPGG